MKKLALFLITCVLLFSACSGSGKTFSILEDFEGADIASLSGAVFAQFIDAVIPDVKHNYYNSLADMALALSSGKVDAVALDMPVARLFVAEHEELALFPIVVADDRYGFATAKGSWLAAEADRVLQELIANGTVAEIEAVWFSADDSIKKLPGLNHNPGFDGSAGTIRYGCDINVMPMSYTDADGSPIGFDIDLMSRIAYELNMEIEFTAMAFEALLTALDSGHADAVGGCMSITPERLESVDFIGPYYEGGIVLVVRADSLG
jgi:polar amino acid transport system substrate-binding protein